MNKTDKPHFIKRFSPGRREVIECYGVTCRQAETHVVTSDATRDDTIKRNLDRAVELLDFVAGGGQDRLGEKIFVEAFC